MLLHAFVMVNIYTPVHECSHGTPFRTRWLNESVYRFLSLIYIWTPIYYRYRHAMHHTYTQVRGHERGPDIIMSEPPKLSGGPEPERDFCVTVDPVRHTYFFHFEREDVAKAYEKDDDVLACFINVSWPNALASSF